MFVHARAVLKAAGFSVSMTDHGDGHVNLFARRGDARVLFNCHLDTVPIGEGWTKPPLELTVENDRAYGRGVCDIKGAAAALLTLAESSDARMAILFSSDEEGAGGCCVRNFLADEAHRRFEQAVVCEPTRCEAVLAHRGFLSVKGRFTGLAGHSSEGRALADSAIHRMARWTSAALDHCKREADAGQPTGFNLGLISGGSKSNVIAGEASLHYSARLGPGQSNESLLAELSGLGGAEQCATWHVPFSGPPLPAAGKKAGPARAFCQRHRIDVGEPVDFWTEASLFSEAGMPAMVLGPGDIAQAHTADEWVELDQLKQALNVYQRIVDHG